MISILLAAASLGQLARTDVLAFPLVRFQDVPYSASRWFSNMAICTEIARENPVVRSDTAGKIADTFEVDRVRVLSGAGVAPGAELKVLTLRWRDKAVASFEPGQKLLILFTRQESGGLEFPHGNGQVMWDSFYYTAKAENEVLGLACFETRASTLPPVSEAPWQWIAAVAESVKGSSDRNIAWIQRAITYPPTYRYPDVLLAAWPDRFARLFIDAAEHERPYVRAMVYYKLNNLDYLGTGDEYLQAVLDAAHDPSAFQNAKPEWPTFWEARPYNAQIPRNFEHHAPSPDAWANAIRTCDNSHVYEFLLEFFPFTPNPEIEKRIASLLDSPQPMVRWNTAKRLAAWHKDAEHSPAPYRAIYILGQPQLSYPNLDSVVKYWKAREAAQ